MNGLISMIAESLHFKAIILRNSSYPLKHMCSFTVRQLWIDSNGKLFRTLKTGRISIFLMELAVENLGVLV